MGNNVVPRQQGDAYQAMHFWLNAGKLFQPHTYVTQVSWEADNTGGFDDVIVHYREGHLLHGVPIIRECISVKHHVSNERGFDYRALIDPSFINSQKSTILSRLFDAYKEDPNIASHTVFHMINTWGLDLNDPFCKLISNAGQIILDKLFDGTTDGSKHGIIRKALREHIGVDDTTLKEVLRPLRISASYDDVTRIVDRVNDKLQAINFQTMDAGKRASGYVELIQRLHAEGVKDFTQEKLHEICDKEGLIIVKESLTQEFHIIGLRSFRKGAEDLVNKVHTLSCHLNKFNDRFLEPPHTWEAVSAEVKALADAGLATKKPLKLYLDTHLSLAFVLGYELNPKVGAQVSIVQRTLNAELLFQSAPIEVEKFPRPIWGSNFIPLNPDGKDLAVAIGATHDITNEVLHYVSTSLPDAIGLLVFNALPKPSSTVFQNGSHIAAAAQDIIEEVRKQKGSIKMRGGICHIFMAAPVSFAFSLGQQSMSLSKLIVYEFDFQSKRDGGYHPGVRLPL
ncbi:SAVED domain-containing protein [Chitinophaga sp. OAE865]|uniref:SAVED domain-containing protein n=1 Tax=Chitinophaga sp. OAE865 TaxID=2817898 RepID=UPI001AE5303F